MTILFTLFILAAFLNRKNPFVLAMCLIACVTEFSNLIEIAWPYCQGVYATIYLISGFIAHKAKTKQGDYYLYLMLIGAVFSLSAAVAYSANLLSFFSLYENVMISITIMEMFVLIGMSGHVGRIIEHWLHIVYSLLFTGFGRKGYKVSI